MEICYSAIAFMLVVIVLVVAANYYNDQNARHKKTTVLDRLQNSGKVIHLDVKSSARALSLTGFQFLWQRAEVIFIENAVFYFGYFPLLFGRFRMYWGVAQLSIQNAKMPKLLSDSYSFIIDSARIDKNHLTIAYSRKNNLLPVKRAMTLVIDDTSKLEEIGQMLKAT